MKRCAFIRTPHELVYEIVGISGLDQIEECFHFYYGSINSGGFKLELRRKITKIPRILLIIPWESVYIGPRSAQNRRSDLFHQ